MATLEISLEANYDRRTKLLIGARATALPKNGEIKKIFSQKFQDFLGAASFGPLKWDVSKKDLTIIWGLS